jgi:hypothetical protein
MMPAAVLCSHAELARASNQLDNRLSSPGGLLSLGCKIELGLLLIEAAVAALGCESRAAAVETLLVVNSRLAALTEMWAPALVPLGLAGGAVFTSRIVGAPTDTGCETAHTYVT